MKKLCTLLALIVATPLAFIGCTDNNTDGLQVDASPTFTYFGRVTDTSAKPLPGAEVCIWFDGKDTCVETEADNDRTAKDEAGTYFIDGVPFDSEVKVTVNLTIPAVEDDPDTEDVDESVPAISYFPSVFTVWTGADQVLGGYFGNQVTYQDNTQQQLDLTLVAANYDATGYVFANGVPAEGATVVLDLRSEGFPIYDTATVDADGMFTFAGLPASSLEYGIDYEIYVLPYDKDGDGMADFEAEWSSFDPFWSAPNKWVFNLRFNDGSMSVRYSNVEDGSHGSADPIMVVFNQVITSADISLTDTTRYNFPIAFTYEIVAGIKLVITPVGPLSGSSEFWLSVTGSNSANGNSASDSWYFNTGGAGDVAAITGLALQDPTDTFDLDDNCFNVTWTTDPNAEEYCIYAMNNGAATDWNRIDCYSGGGTSSPAFAMQNQEVCVPDYYNRKFDSINGDSWWTGLEGGTEITFVVTGINFLGSESPIAGADTLTVADTMGPDMTNGSNIPSRSGSVYNPADTPAGPATTVTLSVSFSEYMDQTTEPAITFAAGTAPDGAPAGAVWAWDNDGQGGTFTFDVADGKDHRGSTYSIDFTGVKDTSGNEFDEDVDSGTADVQIVTPDLPLSS